MDARGLAILMSQLGRLQSVLDNPPAIGARFAAVIWLAGDRGRGSHGDGAYSPYSHQPP
jgi:hypothetical protein